MSAIKKVCILGMGYIGLPTAVVLADAGYSVLGVDIDRQIVDTINRGKIHIIEPGLEEAVHRAVQNRNLIASIRPETADVFIIAVPTPFHSGYVPNIDYVLSAARSIVPFVGVGNIVILESTSPIGTTELVAKTLAGEGIDIDTLFFAHCPERVLPGKAMIELIANDRIVGGLTPSAIEKAIAFYKTFVKGDVLGTDARTAEMVKLAENSFRDVNIAFANELSILCDKFDINVWELIRLANHHPRVNILQPGCGVGGHCIAVDPWFIVHAGGGDAKIIRTAREVNDRKSEMVIEKIRRTADLFEKANKRSPVIAIMGLTFKPDIDDLRESPAVYIASRIISEAKAQVLTVEPNVKAYKEFTLTPYQDAYQQADIVVWLVRHKEFLTILTDNGKMELDFCGVRRTNIAV
jgi:UDP-N-acetyl-D-mannosaminuronic acid dehydrogenase